MAKRRTLALLLCLLLLLCTACGGQTQDDAGALRCTVTIECSTVLEHMDALNPGKADINGKRMCSFDLRILPSSGNDEIRLITSFA